MVCPQVQVPLGLQKCVYFRWLGLYLLGEGQGEGRRYLVPTYSLASCSTVPLAAGVIRDSEKACMASLSFGPFLLLLQNK